MDRNETFTSTEVTLLKLRLAWASVDISTANVENIEVCIAGSDEDVAALRTELNGMQLLIEQPNLGLKRKMLTTNRWMHIILRMPAGWKGGVDASSISGKMSMSGICGTDLTMETVSGSLRAEMLSGIQLKLTSTSGSIKAGALKGDKLNITTVSGSVRADSCTFQTYRCNSS